MKGFAPPRVGQMPNEEEGETFQDDVSNIWVTSPTGDCHWDAQMLHSPFDSRDTEDSSLMILSRTASEKGTWHETLETGAGETASSDRVVGAHAIGVHAATGLPVTESKLGDGKVAWADRREEWIGCLHDPASSLLPGAFNPRADAEQLGPQLGETGFSSTTDLFADLCDFDFEKSKRLTSSNRLPQRDDSARRIEPREPTGALRDTWSLSGYCQEHMNIRPHEIKPLALLRMLDLTSFFYHMCAEGIVRFVEAESGQVASIFGFSRMLVFNVAEFARRMSDWTREDRRQCWHAKQCQVRSHPTRPWYELLRQLGIHPVRGTRIRELSALDARNLMLHSEFAFSPDRMAKNCIRLKIS